MPETTTSDAAGPAMGTAAPLARTGIYAFLKRPSLVDFAGHLAAVFFVSGCNYRCGFCHNWGQLGQRRPGISVDRLERVCKDFADQWVDGVVISGGEPTLHEDLPDLIARFRRHGFAVKLDTNGSRPAALARVLDQVDMVAMDLKCAPENYADFVGWPHPETVSECLDLLRGSSVDWELRTTIVPGRHDAAEMRRIGGWIGHVPRHVVQAFVPRDDMPDPDLQALPRTPPALLHELAGVMKAYADDVVVRGG